MNKSLSYYRNVVQFFVDRGESPAKAIDSAGVPIQFRDGIAASYAPSSKIKDLTIIVDDPPKTILCPKELGDLPDYRFDALEAYLIDSRKWLPQTVDALGAASAKLVSRLPDPTRNQRFQSRGLVVGYIQSGKTANMAGLIARAVDRGYNLIIVLAGLYRDLRMQTQRRFDQEIAGRSDSAKDGPFVRHDKSTPAWIRLTTSGLSGDFSQNIDFDSLDPAKPMLAVVKKNVRVLDTFISWLKDTKKPLDKLSVLVIDDESDQGSINTNYGRTDDNGDPIDPSKTNAKIRDLLETFPKCAYVGFTATPFANVLIDSREEQDLYPRDFIAVLDEPEGYFGPRQLFGLGMSPSDLSPDDPFVPALSVIKHLDVQAMRELRGISKAKECPAILSEALLSFVISSCARLYRGDKGHFTMLVHPSHKTVAHNDFAKCLTKEIEFLAEATRAPRKFVALQVRAKRLWNSWKIAPEFRKPAFESIWPFARAVVAAMEVKVLNTDSKDELDYSGVSKRYVVIGGNRLSRGLTLEGLSISVFLRDTAMYDTLLQMGRWFGFRRAYYDLTRIYVEPIVAQNFADLARVEGDLRADLEKFSREKNPPSPRAIFPKIRLHPSMAVTSPLKLGNAGRPDSISFDGRTAQTVTLPVDNFEDLRENIDLTAAWLKGLGRQSVGSGQGPFVWKDVSYKKVLEFIKEYAFSPDAKDVDRHYLMKYIESQVKKKELTVWDVVIPSGNQTLDPFTWREGVRTFKTKRSRKTPTSIGTLKSDSDTDIWRRIAKRPVDDPKRGVLFLYSLEKSIFQPAASADIIAFVILFPPSKTASKVQYVSQG